MDGTVDPHQTAEAPSRASWDPPEIPLPEGWYPDPLDQTLLRYFDGSWWTYWTSEREASSGRDDLPDQPDQNDGSGKAALRDDIAQAKRDSTGLVGSGKETRLLEQYLRPNERVIALASASGDGIGVLACTNMRLLFLFAGIVRRQFVEVDWLHASSVVFDRKSKQFGVYTGRVTKRSLPALQVKVFVADDAIRVARAAEAAAAAPRLDIT